MAPGTKMESNPPPPHAIAAALFAPVKPLANQSEHWAQVVGANTPVARLRANGTLIVHTVVPLRYSIRGRRWTAVLTTSGEVVVMDAGSYPISGDLIALVGG